MNDLKTRWNDLAHDIGQTCLQVLDGPPITITEKRLMDPKVLATALLSRSLGNFKAALLLIESGLVVEARILARCCFENAFWIAGLVADGDEFAQKMRHDDLYGRKAISELVLTKHKNLKDSVEQGMRERLRKINDELPKGGKLSPQKVALSGLLESGYLLYCQLSADAAHPSLTALARHLGRRVAPAEAMIDVMPDAKGAEVIQTLDWTCNAVLGACVGLNQILGGTPGGVRLNELADRYYALSTG